GQLTLRDTPCAKGETQEIRSMTRPIDPAPIQAPAAAIPASSSAPAPAPQTTVIYRTPPQPMYECIAPDGSRYASDTGEGNPRWVPLWTLGYPTRARAPVVEPGRARIRVDDGHINGSLRS